MANNTSKIGFSYFSSKEYLLNRPLNAWLPALQRWGSSMVILAGNFDLAVPEDVFICAQNNHLEPVVHFKTVLPTARAYNDAALMLDIYKKWGAQYVILGHQPNDQTTWPVASWHYETLVDRYLDRFIPLANHAVRIGLQPVLAPMHPGGDYWDCAFLELFLSGLKRRRMQRILNKLVLSSYGYTFHKPLSWGEGGPERWPGSKPYLTPEDQEDQIGFHNFEWAQAASQRITGEKLPVIILDAGRPGPAFDQHRDENAFNSMRQIFAVCNKSKEKDPGQTPVFNEKVLACTFSLDTLQALMGQEFSVEGLDRLFDTGLQRRGKAVLSENQEKQISHYLLLPSYDSGVSDVVLNKVKPLIKHLRPTVGFSLEEASYASKVSIFPDPFLFKDEHINALRKAGCKVEILPNSGIEIATYLQG